MKKEKLIWLNGNASNLGYFAVGSAHELVLGDEIGAWDKVRDFLDDHPSEYVFGWLGYDLKNDTERLTSNNQVWVETPIVYLMVAENLGKLEGEELLVIKGSEEVLLAKIEELKNARKEEPNEFRISPSINENTYLEDVKAIKQHIHLGDIYEANYCYEFRGSGKIHPYSTYHRLNQLTKAPFSVYAQIDQLSVISASPERFLKKEGSRVFTQPIKGTIRRGATTDEDQELIDQLQNNQKDRSENIMIVDLVRNDLSRIAAPSSVKVDELCQIYTFENIHQMISTVSAQVDDSHPVDILKALFPMGSMTGAPKIRAMELMEEYEHSKRGLYSGCIGYFTPERDFDFNVVIRTIIYDDESQKSSFSVGGAITDLSTPEGEYEETKLKANALLKALSE